MSTEGFRVRITHKYEIEIGGGTNAPLHDIL